MHVYGLHESETQILREFNAQLWSARKWRHEGVGAQPRNDSPINMPEAAPKGRGRPKGLKNGEGKPLKSERLATHTMKTRGK